MAKLNVERALRQAKVHQLRGEIEQARGLYNQILAAFPQNARAKQGLEALQSPSPTSNATQNPPQERLNQLVTLYNQGQLARVAEQAAVLTGAFPKSFVLWNILGAANLGLRRLDQAENGFRKASELNPNYAAAHYNMGVAFQNQGKLDEAIAAYQRALAIKPEYAEAYNNMGNALQNQGKLDEAIAAFQRALAIRPDYAEAHNNMGVALRGQGKLDEAIAAFQRALAIKPDYADAPNNMGNALRDQGKPDEAIAAFQRALAIKPDFAGAHNNMGIALWGQGKVDEAIAAYQCALAIKPDFAKALYNKSLLQLLNGDLEAGWRGYEWRWKAEDLGLFNRDFAQPLWLGENGIEGKTILLHSEQGFGDTIQFCRYVPLVAARGARVLLEVPKALRDLMASVSGVAQVISAKGQLPHFDMRCPLHSLPLAFETRIESIPANVPYLTVPSESVSGWNLRLGSKRRPTIGLTWSGNPTHKNDANRSISLRSLSQLLDVNADFVSLQKDVRPDDAALLKDRSDLMHLGKELKTFSDTAAVISKLDLVISVDTSVAHLAGALAKPVWVLLPFVPDWRWLLDREDSPWYPTARLFRQNVPGDWSSVISRVVIELEKLLHVDESAPA